jgi:predicted Zn-dependent protease
LSVATDRLRPAHEVVESALGASRADGCVVVVEESLGIEVRFARNTTTTNGQRRERRVTVVSFRARPAGGGDADGPDAMSVGIASASGAGNVEDLVRASEADAERAGPADDAAPLIATGREDRHFADPPSPTDLTALAPVLDGLHDAFHRARAHGRVLAGFADQRVDTTYLGTSEGLRCRHVQPTGKLELVARTNDGTASAWAGVGASRFEEGVLEGLEDRLVQRLGWAQRRIELPAGRYEVLMPPDAVADLVIMLAEAASGRDAEDGRNVFSAPGGGTKVGTAITPHPFELRSDPAEAGLECAPFLVTTASSADVSVFDNGLALERTEWIKDGVVRRLRYHRAGAARAGLPPTPPVDNLVLEAPGATASLDDLISGTQHGLLLTCLWYIREVDPVTLLLTGLTRDGVYLVEGGEVVGAVNNFRFNESPVDLLAHAEEAGRSERALSREWGEWLNRTAMPPLRVAEFNMSSVSPAT